MITVGYDAIRKNISKLPPGQHAGYTTGTDGSNGTLDIRWRNDDFNDDPGAVRICQDFQATDVTADILDVESGAATLDDCPVWVGRANHSRSNKVRPGQRTPAIYTSASNVTPVANALVHGGVKSGVGLWIANWSLSEAQAISDVQAAAGPFPIIGVQYSSGQFFDYDIWGTEWLASGNGIASNPVRNLREIEVGYTHVIMAWDSEPQASGYTVKAFRVRGQNDPPDEVREYTVTASDCRIRSLRPGEEYEITVRAHPARSQGADATRTVKTR